VKSTTGNKDIIKDVFLAKSGMNNLRIDSQIQELDEWIKSNPDPRELKRALAVKLALSGWANRAIASLLNTSNSFISKWKKQFNKLGIEGLRLGYKGAKSYLTTTGRAAVVTWLQQQKYWDLSELECYLIEQFDVVFQSHKSYYDLLKEARVSWQKAQRSQPRKDPELVKKKTQFIREMLKGLMSDIKTGNFVLYAIDEVHLLEGDLLSHLWGDSKERLHIPIINEKNRQTYYGALDLFQDELIVSESEKGDGDCTVDFIKKLIARNPTHQIIIFWDGAAYHKGEKMRQLLTEVNSGLEPNKWKVTCHLFAPYAPEENPIEAVWLQLKTLLRRCYRFCKNFSIIKRLFKLLVDYKLFKFPNLKNYEAFSCLI
jgi:transposase